MPIVGPTTVDGTATNAPPVSYNVSEYSHSSVFTITRDKIVRENAPPLVTRWIAPSECRDRWMLVDNGADTTTLGNTTFVQTRTEISNTTLLLANTTIPSDGSATITSDEIALPQRAVVVIGKRQLPADQEALTTTRFQYTVWSIDSDPLFTICLPYKDQPLYSPGVCPDGQQVVEVTEVHATETDGKVQTSWQASCCSSGMTFGSDVSRFCQSTITSPLAAHAFITTSFGATPESTEVYEVTTTISGTESTISSMTSLSTGLAVADPVVVAWALQDMSSFPADYRSSLATKIGVTLETGATPGETPSGPEETGDPTPTGSPSLSTGAKAGIGVGVVVGFALVAGIFVFWWLRRKKQNRTDQPEQQTVIAEMADQDETHAKKRWFLGGRWRNEADNRPKPTQELDSKAVHIVPGPPVELDSSEVRHTEATAAADR